MHVLLPKRTFGWRSRSKPAIGKFRHTRTPDDREGWENGVTVPDQLIFGRYGIQVLEEAWVTSKQLEDIRRDLVREMGRKGKLWIRVFPHQTITQRDAETRMGVGRGHFEYWVAALRPNFILFEFDDVSEEVLYQAARVASYRLPCKVKLMKRESRPSDFDLNNVRERQAQSNREV